jgi:hypothetical protein
VRPRPVAGWLQRNSVDRPRHLIQARWARPASDLRTEERRAVVVARPRRRYCTQPGRPGRLHFGTRRAHHEAHQCVRDALGAAAGCHCGAGTYYRSGEPQLFAMITVGSASSTGRGRLAGERGRNGYERAKWSLAHHVRRLSRARARPVPTGACDT